MDDRRTLSTTRPSSGSISRANFAVVRRGFDQGEVRSYLEGLQREMQLLESRLGDLQHQLSEAQHRAEHPELDESTLTAALGAQSAAILRSAHEEAGRVTAEAQERAASLFAQAQERATAYLVEAQERAVQIVAEAEHGAHELDTEARSAAQRLVESARVNGEALVESAREQGRAIVEQAQEARRGVLSDLAVKRKALSVQIEQLRAARDSLQGSINLVRDSVEGVLTGLMSSDEGARAAAIEALRNRPSAPEPTEEEVLANVPLREVPAPTMVAAEEMVIEPVAPAAPANTAVPPSGPAEAEATSPANEPPADVVEEIFARLRKATLEEKAVPASPKRSAAPAPVASVDSAVFTRRDEALEPALSSLVRRAKRALQDDQNVMIERLRGVDGMITTELEDEFAQRARYADAVIEPLRQAALAGAAFADVERSGAGARVDVAIVSEIAADLAVTVVVALRRRLLAEGAGDGAERANAAYKEWRGARIERLCTDVARRAFNAGVAASCAGAEIRFLAAPNDAPCDACARDASAERRLSGQVFPSGQPFPPLHAGCACAVVPV